ncbi:MAG: deoxyribodipyrimidine photo-lyase [Bacteroidetes bacterium]|nr:deoxyribodipyrimidine photo-lyase [Bacteroidota bacterium]
MIVPKKILFWFREVVSVRGNNCLLQCLDDTTTQLIPVFCFDPREIVIAEAFNQKEIFVNQLVNKVLQARKNLQELGSNLLVVCDHYEKVIPSLARVLAVDQVATEATGIEDASLTGHLSQFRNLKVFEINRLLNMHSIPLIVPGQFNTLHFSQVSFPLFPQINPGQIPTANQLLEYHSSKIRSVAC